MEDCIFCKIANGTIGSNTVYEDEDFRAIMDIAPAALGHVIILPKAHAANVFEIDEELYGKGMKLAKKLAAAVKQATGCEGINVLQNNGTAAGQTVFHLHIHIVPRYDEDTVNVKWKPMSPAAEELAAMCEKIRNEI